MLAFDVESTGVDPETARIVTAACIAIGPGNTGVTDRKTWLADPGVEIPAEATEVHGVTTERARAEGRPAAEVVDEIACWLDGAGWNGYEAQTPMVVMNAAYDLTVLARELARYGLGELRLGPVLDVFVIDRACDPYRAGKRTLGDLAAHYQVRQSDAHDAAGDCLTAARVLWRQRQVTATEGPGKWRPRKLDYSPLRRLSLAELQVWQARQHAARQADYQRYLRTKADPLQLDAVVDGSWPWRPAPAPAEVGA